MILEVEVDDDRIWEFRREGKNSTTFPNITTSPIEREEVKGLIRDIVLYSKIKDKYVSYIHEDKKTLDGYRLIISVVDRYMWVFTNQYGGLSDKMCVYVHHNLMVPVKKCSNSIKFISDIINDTARITQKEIWQVITAIEGLYYGVPLNDLWNYRNYYIFDFSFVKISMKDRKDYLDLIEKEGVILL